MVNDLPAPLVTYQLNQKEGYALDERVRRRLSEEESSPLFQGMGTHYSFLWVGTPEQRVSVIVDTGSHYTAFPCVGCKCGKHMDPHFDPDKSSTAVVKTCTGGKKCVFRQSYSEGSSWQAFRVQDKVWVGGQNYNDVPSGRRFNLTFDFGCQSSETGLFRTQNVDGIMGMSAADGTMPFLLMKQKITQTKIFAMCFRIGGGVMTLAGVDTSLNDGGPNSKAGTISDVLYAKMIKPRGWFTIKILDIFLKSPKDGRSKSIGGSIFKCNAGKGTIVDSGTTDTYLPSAISGNFKAIFHELTGFQYANNVVELSPEKYNSLPTIVYRMEGLSPGTFIDVECPPSSYVEKLRNNRYASRVYLTESSGAVLGANFMNNYNVIFDPDGLRIGFAKSTCSYEKISRFINKSVASNVRNNSWQGQQKHIKIVTKRNPSLSLMNYIGRNTTRMVLNDGENLASLHKEGLIYDVLMHRKHELLYTLISLALMVIVFLRYIRQKPLKSSE